MTTIIATPAQQQFEQLFQRSRRRAFRLAYRLTGNTTEAEDLTQDAYVSAWRRFDTYIAQHSFEGWLFRILINRAYDLHRRKKRAPMCSMDQASPQEEDGPSRICEFADPAAGPEEVVTASILEERLEAALQRLPVIYRTTILLCDVEQCSYQEISERTRCTIGTVRSRVHRARALLRRYLESRTAPIPS